LPDGANDAQYVAVRRVARAQMELSRVRTVRATLMATLDFERCDSSELRRVIVLDRYERIARRQTSTRIQRSLSNDGGF
jgi:hypothetical protein